MRSLLIPLLLGSVCQVSGCTPLFEEEGGIFQDLRQLSNGELSCADYGIFPEAGECYVVVVDVTIKEAADKEGADDTIINRFPNGFSCDFPTPSYGSPSGGLWYRCAYNFLNSLVGQLDPEADEIRISPYCEYERLEQCRSHMLPTLIIENSNLVGTVLFVPAHYL